MTNNTRALFTLGLMVLAACGGEDEGEPVGTATLANGMEADVVGSNAEAESFAAACGSQEGYDPQMFALVVGCPTPAVPPPCDGSLTIEVDIDEPNCIWAQTVHCGDAQNVDAIEIVFEGGVPVRKTVTQRRNGEVGCVYAEEAPPSLQCPDGATQIDPSWVCDGEADCPSGADEEGC